MYEKVKVCICYALIFILFLFQVQTVFSKVVYSGEKEESAENTNELRVGLINNNNQYEYVGKLLKFTAESTGKNLKYKWSIYKDSNELYTKPYSEENYLEYPTTETGVYKVGVAIKDESEEILLKESEEIHIVKEVQINSLEIDKKEKQPVHTNLKFTVLAQGYDLTYGWYIYKGSKQVHQKLGTKENYIEYVPKDPGIYKAQAYVRDGLGNYISQYSKEITIYSKENLEKENAEKFVNEQNFSSKTDHFIWVDTEKNVVHVFKGKKNDWNLEKSMACTDGKKSTPTVKGNFTIDGRAPWLTSYNKKVKAKYKVRFYEHYYFHSILYDAKGEKIVDSRLGQSLSHGCIRLSEDNAKWIYDNIKDGTGVHIN